MMGSTRVMMGIVAAAMLLACATGAKHPGYEDAIYAAYRNARSEDGARYLKTVRRHVGRDFDDAARLCYQRIPETRGVTLLFRLDPSGSTLETIVYPVSAFGACILEKLDFFPLPPPPEPDYWVTFRVPPQSV